MRQPSWSVRICGKPRMAGALLILCGGVVLGWLNGDVPGFAAFLAVLVALQTVSAVKRLRAYEAYAAEWQAMGELDGPEVSGEQSQAAAPQKRKKEPWAGGWPGVIGLGVIVFVLYPVAITFDTRPSDALVVFWLIGIAGFLWALVRSVRWTAARMRGRADAGGAVAAGQAKEPEAVACLVGVPSASPSREDAVRDLPEYCARLVGR